MPLTSTVGSSAGDAVRAGDRCRTSSRAGQVACHGALLVAPPKRRVFAGRPDQASAARRFVARLLDGCPVTDTAVLLASELITNALQHTDTATGGTFDVIVWRGRAAACVAIVDGGADSIPASELTEAAGQTAELAESGYGLALVDRLSARWGYRRHDDGAVRGTTVWFLVRWSPT
jgi:anti-sigma regulatory factor (Ser/Thr protein kinase)